MSVLSKPVHVPPSAGATSVTKAALPSGKKSQASGKNASEAMFKGLIARLANATSSPTGFVTDGTQDVVLEVIHRDPDSVNSDIEKPDSGYAIDGWTTGKNGGVAVMPGAKDPHDVDEPISIAYSTNGWETDRGIARVGDKSRKFNLGSFDPGTTVAVEVTTRNGSFVGEMGKDALAHDNNESLTKDRVHSVQTEDGVLFGYEQGIKGRKGKDGEDGDFNDTVLLMRNKRPGEEIEPKHPAAAG